MIPSEATVKVVRSAEHFFRQCQGKLSREALIYQFVQGEIGSEDVFSLRVGGGGHIQGTQFGI